MVAIAERTKTVEVYVSAAEKAQVQEFAARTGQTVRSIVDRWLSPHLQRIARQHHSRWIAPAVRPLPRVRLSRHEIPLQVFQIVRLESARRHLTLPGLLYAMIAPQLRQVDRNR